MRASDRTFLAFYLNSALDTGKYSDVTFEKVSAEINAETIFEFLQERLGRDIDLSLFDKTKKAELVEEWQSLLNAVDARRKFGVVNSGLCLLVAYLLEGIQQDQRSSQKS